MNDDTTQDQPKDAATPGAAPPATPAEAAARAEDTAAPAEAAAPASPFDPASAGIRVVNAGGREFYLLGTAHISRESVDHVEAAVRYSGCDHVVIEIDRQRYRSVTQRRDWSQLDIFKIIRTGQAFLLLSNLVLASFQRRMGVGTGVTPGSEMVAAAHVAAEMGVRSTFGDRPVASTLRRAWAKSGFWGRNKLLAALISGAFTNEKVTEEDLKALREQGELESMLEELADYLPAVKQVLIDERDAYLAQSIWEADGQRVLAVVGAGHVPGITATLERLAAGTQTVDKADLDRIPPPGIVRKAIPWVIPIVVAGLIALGFVRGGVEAGLANLWQWVIVNGTLSALGALIALAHPVTIIASFVGAPITSMNPTIGVGFVTGFLESVLRKPRVADFESLNTDITTVRGFYRNRLTRILLVFLFSTIGSAAGTFIALPLLFG